MKYDIIIAVVPFVEPTIQTGPAILKSYIEQNKFTCKVVDWNFDLWLQCNKKNNKIIRSYGNDDPNMKKYFDQNYKEIFNKWIDEIEMLNPKFLGLSIFSWKTSRSMIFDLCGFIKKRLPDLKIIAGGHGVSMSIFPLGNKLLNLNLIDHYISGEGEEAIIKLLKNESQIDGLDDVYNPTFNEDLDKFPDPDYSDTDPLSYPNLKFPIITSRGCINNCNFCTGYYKRFITRNSKNIVNEIYNVYKKYKYVRFQFIDSLSNGNRKQLLDTSKLIIQYKNQNLLPENLSWEAFWVCRSEKINDEELYKYIAKSGCKEIIVGLESGSKKVRNEMNKSTKDSDVLFMFEQCKKYNIRVNIILLVGYYTENETDFNENLKLISKGTEILGENISINVGSTYRLSTHNNIDHSKIKYDQYNNWYSSDNDYPTRVYRWLKIVQYCNKLKVRVNTHFKERLKKEIIPYENHSKFNAIKHMFDAMD
jgi:radical SAM superfamily enzyme YgiQ (UPF0313 family)